MVDLFGADRAPERNAISRWMSGAFTPGLDNLYMLAIALGVRPAWLAFNDGDMTDDLHLAGRADRLITGESEESADTHIARRKTRRDQEAG
jgi:hypothetical protein